jgi:hypothetical protein
MLKVRRVTQNELDPAAANPLASTARVPIPSRTAGWRARLVPFGGANALGKQCSLGQPVCL